MGEIRGQHISRRREGVVCNSSGACRPPNCVASFCLSPVNYGNSQIVPRATSNGAGTCTDARFESGVVLGDDFDGPPRDCWPEWCVLRLHAALTDHDIGWITHAGADYPSESLAKRAAGSMSNSITAVERSHPSFSGTSSYSSPVRRRIVIRLASGSTIQYSGTPPAA